jgi:hypothetical protein
LFNKSSENGELQGTFLPVTLTEQFHLAGASTLAFQLLTIGKRAVNCQEPITEYECNALINLYSDVSVNFEPAVAEVRAAEAEENYPARFDTGK